MFGNDAGTWDHPGSQSRQSGAGRFTSRRLRPAFPSQGSRLAVHTAEGPKIYPTASEEHRPWGELSFYQFVRLRRSSGGISCPSIPMLGRSERAGWQIGCPGVSSRLPAGAERERRRPGKPSRRGRRDELAGPSIVSSDCGRRSAGEVLDEWSTGCRAMWHSSNVAAFSVRDSDSRAHLRVNCTTGDP